MGNNKKDENNMEYCSSSFYVLYVLFFGLRNELVKNVVVNGIQAHATLWFAYSVYTQVDCVVI